MLLLVLRFYGPVNPTGSCRARLVYLTTRLLGSHGLFALLGVILFSTFYDCSYSLIAYVLQ